MFKELIGRAFSFSTHLPQEEKIDIFQGIAPHYKTLIAPLLSDRKNPQLDLAFRIQRATKIAAAFAKQRTLNPAMTHETKFGNVGKTITNQLLSLVAKNEPADAFVYARSALTAMKNDLGDAAASRKKPPLDVEEMFFEIAYNARAIGKECQKIPGRANERQLNITPQEIRAAWNNSARSTPREKINKFLSKHPNYTWQGFIDRYGYAHTAPPVTKTRQSCQRKTSLAPQ